ncbi:MAG: hypothetical protein KDC44_20325, partial [Phaeodactylibacter sp.]|nr:hypothetical protein [Phaeodactylibacter sp.]
PALATFFFGNRSVALPPLPELYLPKRWMQIGRMILKPLLVVGLPLLSIYEYKQYEIPKPHPMAATYEPVLFVVNQDTFEQIQPDSVHWKKWMVDRFYSKVITQDGQTRYYRYDVDTTAQTIELMAYRDSSDVHAFTYEWIDSTQILVKGIYRSDTLTVQLKMKRPEDYLLMSRGFHWVNEYPFNR